MSDSEEDADGKPKKKLVGFLFGNVDNELELEKEDGDRLGFDERARENLGSVGNEGKLGGATIEVKNLKGDEAEDDYDEEEDGPVRPGAGAVDFADETETIVPVPQTTYLARDAATEEDDYDDYDEEGGDEPPAAPAAQTATAPSTAPGPAFAPSSSALRAAAGPDKGAAKKPKNAEAEITFDMPVSGTEYGKPILKFTELFHPGQQQQKKKPALKRAIKNAKRVAEAERSRIEKAGETPPPADDEDVLTAPKGPEGQADADAEAEAPRKEAPKAAAAAAAAEPLPMEEEEDDDWQDFVGGEALRPGRRAGGAEGPGGGDDDEGGGAGEEGEDASAPLADNTPDACCGPLELGSWEDGIAWGEDEPHAPPEPARSAAAPLPPGAAVGRAVERVVGGRLVEGRVEEWAAEDGVYSVVYTDGMEDEVTPEALVSLLIPDSDSTGGSKRKTEGGDGTGRRPRDFLGERSAVEGFGGRAGVDAADAAEAPPPPVVLALAGRGGGQVVDDDLARWRQGPRLLLGGSSRTRAPAPRAPPLAAAAAAAAPPARGKPARAPAAAIHPQMLRIEPPSGPVVAKDAAEGEAGAGGAASDKENEGGGVGGGDFAASRLPRIGDARAQEEGWLGAVDWVGGRKPRPPHGKPLLLDLNDPRMIFEAPPGVDPKEMRAAAATIVAGSGRKKGTSMAKLLAARVEPPAPGLEHLAHLNASKDECYVTAVKRKGVGKGVGGARVLHSTPAMVLQTSPTYPSTDDIVYFHRPRGPFVPYLLPSAAEVLKKKPSSKPIKLTIHSLSGRKTDFQVPPEMSIARMMSEYVFKKKKWADLQHEPKLVFYLSGGKDVYDPGYVGGAKKLRAESAIVDQGLRDWCNLVLVCRKVNPLPTRAASACPPADKPQRPPGAFSKKQELTGMSGKIVLMEYMEEHPLLLSFQGMGARLQTYYRQKDRGDQGGEELARTSGRAVQVLGPEDDSPFLGDVPPGQAVESMETNLYRAPVFEHQTSETDFLLVRSATGRMHLREITGMRAVGQEEPHRRIYAPGSQPDDKAGERRLLVHVYREMRQAQLKGKQQGAPAVNIFELAKLFPRQGEGRIRKWLRPICEGMNSGSWRLKGSSKIPNEEELRKMMTPEMVCAYESMIAGHERMVRAGVTKLKIPERLKTATNQLPDDSHVRKVAKFIELQLLTAPWHLTNCFHEVMKEQRGMLQLDGPADPTGRGRGYSFLKADAPNQPKAAALAKIPGVPGRNTGVTGTNADLRRLSMEQAKQLLMNLGVKEEEIKTLTRWRRIDLVRTLSTAAAQDGGPSGGNVARFARGTRMSAVQQQMEYTQASNKIFKAQVEVLSATGGEVLERLDAEDMGKDLEDLLAASDEEDEEEDKEGEDEAEHLQELKHMLAAGGTPKEKFTGKRRLRRTIITQNPGGGQTRREEIITNPDKMQEIKDMMMGIKSGGGGGGGAGGDENEARRMKRLAERQRQAASGKLKKNTNVVCSACGVKGHMKTNVVCPKYEETRAKRELAGPAVRDPRVRIEGTKVTFNMTGAKRGRKRRRGDYDYDDEDEDWAGSEEDDIDPSKYGRKAGDREKARERRERGREGHHAANPALQALQHRQDLAKILGVIHGILKDAKGPPCHSELFVLPVGKKNVPDYMDFVSEKMALKNIRQNITELKYRNRGEFRAHVKLIRDNAVAYNREGAGRHRAPMIIDAAEALLKLCDDQLHFRSVMLGQAEDVIARAEPPPGYGAVPGAGGMMAGAVPGAGGMALPMDDAFLSGGGGGVGGGGMGVDEMDDALRLDDLPF